MNTPLPPRNGGWIGTGEVPQSVIAKKTVLFTSHLDGTSPKTSALNRDGFQGNSGGYNYTHWTVSLQQGIPSPNAFRIKRVSIPYDFYHVNESNNSFLVIENGVSITKTITPGNYTPTTFATALQGALRSSPSVNTYSVTYSAATGKVTILVTGGVASTIAIGFAATTAQARCAKLIGFYPSYTTGVLSCSGAGATIVPPAPLCPSFYTHFILGSSTLEALTYDRSINVQDSSQPKGLVRVPLRTCTGDYSSAQPTQREEYTTQSQDDIFWCNVSNDVIRDIQFYLLPNDYAQNYGSGLGDNANPRIYWATTTNSEVTAIRPILVEIELFYVFTGSGVPTIRYA